MLIMVKNQHMIMVKRNKVVIIIIIIITIIEMAAILVMEDIEYSCARV
jgi:hypothetical protein